MWSAMVPLDRALSSSCKLSIITIPLSPTAWPQFAMQILTVGFVFQSDLQGQTDSDRRTNGQTTLRSTITSVAICVIAIAMSLLACAIWVILVCLGYFCTCVVVFLISTLLCGRPIGCITRRVHPSVRPSVPYGLVTRKERNTETSKLT